MSEIRDTGYQGPDRRRGGPDRRTVEQIKLLLVDDHALFRMGVRGLLEREPDFLIVGEAEDGRGAIEIALETSPDVILMDLTLPPPGGIETTQRIKRELPSVGIIVLAQNEEEDALFDAIKAGAAAFILKDVGPGRPGHDHPARLDGRVPHQRQGLRQAGGRVARPQGVPRARRLRPGRRPDLRSRSPRARSRSSTTSPRA